MTENLKPKAAKKATITDENRAESDRLREIWKSRKPNMSQAAFGEAYGIGGQSAISNYLNGHSALNMPAAAAFAKGLGCKISDFSPRLEAERWRIQDGLDLLTHETEELTSLKSAGRIQAERTAELRQSDREDRALGQDRYAVDLELNPSYPAIKRVKFKLSAGASGFAIEYLVEDDDPIVFRREWFASRQYDPAKLFAVRVANGSMQPGLWDGDTVVVNTGDSEPKDGEVFAINYEGELVVKRLIRDEGRWWMHSDNPDQNRYPRKACTEQTKIIGRIVHRQSEHI